MNENRDALKVIRLSDGLVMDFKMLLKAPNTPNQRYWGPVQVGQIDHAWINTQTQNKTNSTANQVNLVS